MKHQVSKTMYFNPFMGLVYFYIVLNSFKGRSFVRLFVRPENFPSRKFARRRENLDRVGVIDFVQKLSKSELSSRFLGSLKFEKSTRHFWANYDDRPGICENLIRIRTNPGTID